MVDVQSTAVELELQDVWLEDCVDEDVGSSLSGSHVGFASTPTL